MSDPIRPDPIRPAVRLTSAERTLLVSSAFGTIIEWYDFFVFAAAAALVFDRAFFPRVDPLVGVLLSLMTYAVGFATRPVGGVIFGVLGDRHGRKQALIWSLFLMGLATVGVGLVPSYATIGVAAPVLLVLLRLTQGIAVGGEVGGALLLVTESLPRARRGLWAAFPMIGGAAGNLIATGVLALLGIALGDAAFVAWGWRVAFVASGLLIAVGVWMRARVAESPLYRAYVARRHGVARAPLRAALRSHGRAVLTVLLVKAAENAIFYVFTTFFVVYVTRVLHRPRTLALAGTFASSAVEIAVIFATGAWSDRVGRRPVTALGLVAAALFVFLLFPATAHGTAATVIAVAALGGAVHGCIVGGMAPFFVELFPTPVRYTGFSAGYQFATVISGAVAPIIGVALLERFGSSTPVSIYAAAMAAPGLAMLWASRETAGTDLEAESAIGGD